MLKTAHLPLLLLLAVATAIPVVEFCGDRAFRTLPKERPIIFDDIALFG